MDSESFQVDGIINGSLEFLRTKRQGQHGLLGLAHRQIDRRGLEHVLRIFW